MQSYSLRHVDDAVLLRDLSALVAKDRATTALLLAHIAEADSRKLYAEMGYSAMFYYCVRELGFSEDMSGRRIRAARVARRFPPVFEAVEDGRLHVTALCLLSKPLKSLSGEAAAELLRAAEHKTKEQIELLLAERFPQPDVVTRVRAFPDSAECVLSLQAPAHVDVPELSGEARGATAEPIASELASEPSSASAPNSASSPSPPAPPDRTRPLSPGRFALQLTMPAETHEKLRRAQDLLGHVVDRRDLAAVLDRALDALLEKLDRRRYGATDRPREARPSRNKRHIPSSVRRAVRARDGKRCTFTSDAGVRCEARDTLEFDHVIPVAKGGETTVGNLRLRCRAHNQLAADHEFGVAFMHGKREKAQQGRAQRGSPESLH